MRNIKIAPGEYYHIFNRGMNKQNIFLSKYDYIRFLLTLMFLQSSVVITNIKRMIDYYVQHSVLHIEETERQKIIRNRYIEIVSFCLMPNHFHIIVKEVDEGGISRYMQRVLNSYTKYFNKKYDKSGHLFQGPYKAVHIKDDRQLLYLSTYIHKNPTELSVWKNKEIDYPWSSFQDYRNNRWIGLIETGIISEQFKNSEDYVNFVRTSTAKEIKQELVVYNE